MTTTRRLIRERMLSHTEESLGFLGVATATASATDRLRDATRFDMDTLAREAYADSFLRLTKLQSGTATASGATTLTDSTAPFTASGVIGALVSAFNTTGGATVGTITANSTSVLTVTAWSNGTPSSTSAYVVDYGFIGKTRNIDPSNGDIKFDPAVTTVVQSGTRYELWRHNLRGDAVDRAMDRALTTRCSPLLTKPLSMLKEVTDWSLAAYSGSSGGVVNAGGVVTELSFPQEIFPSSQLVTNTGAVGYIASESLLVQPQQQFTVWGRVSTRAQTASVRVRDITQAADITLQPSTPGSTFTLKGWQWFALNFTIPTGCGEIQLWLGGTSASCISEWAGVGLLDQQASVVVLESRVLSKHDVGIPYAYGLPATPSGQLWREPVRGVRRVPSGDGVALYFEGGPGAWPVYYQERHRYPALQTDYLTATDRVTGDEAVTACNVDYAAWATIVELLEGRKQSEELAITLKRAYKELRAWDRRVGADPLIVPEFSVQGRPRMLAL